MTLTNSFSQNGYQIVDDFLPTHHYQLLINTIQTWVTEDHFMPAKIGRSTFLNYNSTIRSDRIAWLDENTENLAINAYLHQLEQLRTTLNQTFYLGLFTHEAHFAIYQPNSFYKKHIDQFATSQDRRISCVYYLNPIWEKEFGGELKLYDKEDQPLSTILPIGNRFVFFNSDLPHEVLTAYQTRYSIAAWLKRRPSLLS